jgi:hypothetical protein
MDKLKRGSNEKVIKLTDINLISRRKLMEEQILKLLN